MNPNVPHYVYRCYDVHGTLLYIGCTADVEGRIAMHLELSNRNPSSWFIRCHLARYEAVEYANKATAHAAEIAAIVAEAPLLNVHHSAMGRQVPDDVFFGHVPGQRAWLAAASANKGQTARSASRARAG